MTTDLTPTPASGATTPRQPGAAWIASARSERVRTHLGEAGAHLAAAWKHLTAQPYDHAAVLDEALASCRASLLAFLTDYGVNPDPEAPLAALGARTLRNSGVLKTPVNRVLVLAERAPGIRQRTGLSSKDREVVESGCYTARNLLETVRTVIPAALVSSAAPATSHS